VNDCLWLAMSVCKDKCKCTRYLSMNSNEGQKIGLEWEKRVDEILEPVALAFAYENGFGGSEYEM
jgi:hypothetical protein